MQEKWSLLRKKIERVKDKTDDEKQTYEDQVRELKESAGFEFTEIAVVRHETALAKVPEIIAFLKDTLEIQDKIVVFTHHKDVLEALYDEFSTIACKVTGDVPFAARAQAIAQFQDKEPPRIA